MRCFQAERDLKRAGEQPLKFQDSRSNQTRMALDNQSIESAAERGDFLPVAHRNRGGIEKAPAVIELQHGSRPKLLEPETNLRWNFPRRDRSLKGVAP